MLKNFGSRVLADEEERRKLGYVGAGLITTVTAFLKTADLLNQSSKEVKEKKSEIQKMLCIITRQAKKYDKFDYGKKVR